MNISYLFTLIHYFQQYLQMSRAISGGSSVDKILKESIPTDLMND